MAKLQSSYTVELEASRRMHVLLAKLVARPTDRIHSFHRVTSRTVKASTSET